MDHGQATAEHNRLDELGEPGRIALDSEIVIQNGDENGTEGNPDEIDSTTTQCRAAQYNGHHGGEQIRRAEREVGRTQLTR